MFKRETDQREQGQRICHRNDRVGAKRSCPSGACSGSRSDPARKVHVQDQEAETRKCRWQILRMIAPSTNSIGNSGTLGFSGCSMSNRTNPKHPLRETLLNFLETADLRPGHDPPEHHRAPLGTPLRSWDTCATLNNGVHPLQNVLMNFEFSNLDRRTKPALKRVVLNFVLNPTRGLS
jgi:hypothetical protein